MPDAPNGIHLAQALRDNKEMRMIASSIAALEVRRAKTRAPEEIAHIDARTNRLTHRAGQLADRLVPNDELEKLRIELADKTNTEDFGGVVESTVPVLFLPIRLQTRLAQLDDQSYELRIRFLPDTVAIHSHEPELTPAEHDLGVAYWASVGTAADANAKLAAWTVLVTGALGPERAAWIALRTDPNGDVDEQALERLEAWTRAPAVDVLPERFTVRAYRRGNVLFERTTERLVSPSLEVGIDPNNPGANAADATSIDELINGLPSQLAWLTDFTEAEERGMALRVPLSAADAAAGIDRLIVLGVRTGADPDHGALLVRELLDGHHYTEGLAIAPRDAPTNNTEESGSWFVSNPPPSLSQTVERGEAMLDLSDPQDRTLDGAQLAQALGIDATTFAHVRGADGTDQREATSMAIALWPASWGYYLKQILADTIAPDTITQLRRHFVQHVRGRGPLPPIRTGPNPYGVLPATSLTRRASAPANEKDRAPRWLAQFLGRLRQDWLSMSADSPRVGRTGDVGRDLYEIMTMQATAATFASSSIYGEEFTGTSSGFFDLWGPNWGDVFPFLQPPTTEMRLLLRRLGLNENERPRVSTFVADEPVPIEGLDTVHSQVGPQPLPGTPNYIGWLATASVEDIREERGVPAGAKNTILYRVLRHSVLTAYLETAKTILIQLEALPAMQMYEPELVAMPGVDQPSPYRHLDAYFAPPNGGGEVRIGDYLNRVDLPYASRTHGQVIPQWLTEFLELRYALLKLSQVPTERLLLLFAETLDCCSHRLDAWITSLATQRLEDMRRSRPEGVYVGAFGWVEDLRPRTAPAAGGYILAPSSSHATAAAMLRSGYLSHGGTQGSPLAVELSSHRVKKALWMFDSIGAGNSLAAVLGYRFERLLHDAPANLGLEQYLPALREAFPIDSGKLTEPNGPSEALSARDVVNGLQLHNQWVQFAAEIARDPTLNLFENEDLPTGASPQGAAIVQLLVQLDQIYDAMADVALSESVFQVGKGHYERAGAVAAAMAGERQMPEIEITMTPRTGTTIRNRVFLSLDPAPANALVGWNAGAGNASPRAAASPELNRWLAAALGDPTELRVQVRYSDDAGVTREWVQLTSLEVDAIDLLSFFGGADTPRDAELEQRIRYWLTEQDDTRHGIEISFDDPPHWAGAPARPANTRTISEVAELVRTLQRLTGSARAATPRDVASPDQASELPETAIALAVLVSRSKAALSGIWNAYDDLLGEVIEAREQERQRQARNVAADAAGNAPALGDRAPDLTPLDDIRAGCFDLSWYGVNGTVIPDTPDLDANDFVGQTTLWNSIVARAEAALVEVEKRLVPVLDVHVPADIDQTVIAAELAKLDALSSAADQITSSVNRCVAMLKGIFGKGFVVVQPFTLRTAHPLRAAHTTESPNALAGATAGELARWLFQVSQTHPTLMELDLATIMSAAQSTRGSFAVSASQVPFAAGDRWAAVERPGVVFPAGMLSTVFVGGVRFSDAANERFAGLVLAEWEEVVPNASELAALTFQFDQPSAEPPQVLLLAVPSDGDGITPWTRSELFDILTETLDLARVRTVDPDVIQRYGMVLPALYFTQNFANEAPSTTFVVEAPPVAVAYAAATSSPTVAAAGSNN